jgi:hypothetical protein
MKNYISILLLLACCSLPISGQQPVFFGTDVQGIAFASLSDWESVENHSAGTMELVNQNHNLHLTMWYEHSDLTARDCLAELMDREGLSANAAPFPTLVDQHDAVGVIAGCSEMRRPVKVLLFAVKNSDGYYVLRFKCPDECFTEHLNQMQQLIGSITIRNNKESYIYYANQTRNS